MMTSETYTFNPSLGEMAIYTYSLVEIRGTVLLRERMEVALGQI
jgi:hypothetical protein